MIINLDPNWFLDCDDRSVNLTERKIITGENTRGHKAKAENIGQSREVIHGFYSTIAQACQGYLNKGVASMEGAMTAAQIAAAWEEATRRVEQACSQIPKRPQEHAVVGHKDLASVRPTGVLIMGEGGIVELPVKSSELTYNLPQA